MTEWNTIGVDAGYFRLAGCRRSGALGAVRERLAGIELFFGVA